MQERPGTNSGDNAIGWWILIALLALAAGVGRLCFLIRPFDSDGAMFIYTGKVISEGGRFGHEIVDNKFPTVGLVTGFFWRMFGAHWRPYVLSGAVMSFATMLVLARAARRHFGSH